MKKPLTCQGCSLYGDGEGYVPDTLIPNAPLCIVMQNPGEYEEKGRRVTGYQGKVAMTEPCVPQPAIGPTGYLMDRAYLPLTGYSREEVSVCNVIKCRYRGTNEMPTGEIAKQAVVHCMREHFRVPKGTKVILAQGAWAWRALGGPEPITHWRGHLAPCPYNTIPVLGALHLADLNHDPKAEMWCKLDWKKIGKVINGTWPQPIPETVPFYHLDSWLAQVTSYLAIDTEYNPESRELWLLGMGYPGGEVYQIEWLKASAAMKAGVIEGIRGIAQRMPVVFQNALADVPILKKALGLGWTDFPHLDDTMQAHAILWSEAPHDLEFLASIYGQYPKLKHLHHTDPLLYNKGDVLETMAIWEALSKELQADPLSHKVYQSQLALLPIIEESMSRGIRVNQDRVAERLAYYRTKIQAASQIAQAYCGWPINLASDDQLSQWCYGLEKMKEQKGKKSKGPSKGVKKGNTINQDARAVLRGKYLPFDPEEDENPTESYIMDRIEKGGHPLLEAKHLQGNAEQCVRNYLEPLVVG